MGTLLFSHISILSMLLINREFGQCISLIWNWMIAQNEVNVQGELGNKTDNQTVSYKSCTGRNLVQIK